jgi:hypothetical protein
MLPFMPAEERSLPGMVTVAEGLMRYFVQGPQAVAQFEGRALPPQGEQQQDGYDGNPAPPADDWGGMP